MVTIIDFIDIDYVAIVVTIISFNFNLHYYCHKYQINPHHLRVLHFINFNKMVAITNFNYLKNLKNEDQVDSIVIIINNDLKDCVENVISFVYYHKLQNQIDCHDEFILMFKVIQE